MFAYGPADATAIPNPRHFLPHLNPGARFTRYLTTVLRLSYDNTKVMIDI